MFKLKRIMIVFILFAVNNSAQTIMRDSEVRLTLHAGAEVPTGDLSNLASTGFGIGATFEFWQNNPLAFTVSFNYNHFGAAGNLPSGSDYSLADVPIFLGVRYYPLEGNFHPYLGAEMGLHKLKSSTTRTEERTVTISETSSKFGLNPLIGFRLTLSQTTDLDFNLKYNMITTEGGNTDFLGINGGIQIGL